MGVYPSYGGVEKVSTVLANEFCREGHSVSIVSFEQPYPELAERELAKDIALHKLSYPVYSSSNIKALRDIVKEEQTNFIINQWCVPFYVARLCRKAIKGSRCKLISVHHNLPNTNARIKDIEISIGQGKGNRLLNKIKLFFTKIVSRVSLHYTYEKSDKLVVLSPSFIPIASKFIFKKDTSDILCIPNPITIPANETPNAIKQKEIIYVGRIEYNQKRTYRIVDIWEDIQPSFPDWKCTIVGDGPDREDLEEKIKDKRLSNISIEGFKNPVEYYKRASILILTSEYEGFGLVIVEGMAYKVVPIVLGSYSAVYDIIEQNKSGIIVSYPYSKEDFARQLMSIMRDERLREDMAENAFIKASDFSLPNIIGLWNDLFKNLS